MGVQFPNMVNVDIDKGAAVVQLAPMFLGDALANRIGVNLYKGGEPYSPGGSCAGKAVLSGGGTVVFAGTVSGNSVYIDLPAGAYSEQGPIKISVVWTDGTITATVLEGYGSVRLTETGTIIDPGTVISDVSALIDAIDTAVASIPADYSGLLTTIAPDFSSSANYSAGQYVWYDGTLYRFTADHAAGSWTGTDAVSAVVSTELFGKNSYMEPWQLVLKKYFITDYRSANWTILGNHIKRVVPSSSSTVNFVCLSSTTYTYVSGTPLASYTPTVDKLVPVSVFGGKIRIGLYVDVADGTVRLPRLCCKFFAVSGDTVTAVSDITAVPNTAVANQIIEETVDVPAEATHVLFTLQFSSGVNAVTYDVVYKIDRGGEDTRSALMSAPPEEGGDER